MIKSRAVALNPSGMTMTMTLASPNVKQVGFSQCTDLSVRLQAKGLTHFARDAQPHSMPNTDDEPAKAHDRSHIDRAAKAEPVRPGRGHRLQRIQPAPNRFK